MKTIRLLFAFVCLATLTLPSYGQAKKKSVLNLFCWSEYVPQEVIDGFTKSTGIKVNVENYASNEEMLSKLPAGGSRYDLIQPSEYTIEGLIKADKLEVLNLENLPNLKNLDQKFTKMPHDPDGKFSVPWMAGTVGIVVNTAKVKEPIKGTKDVFSGKYKKRIVVLNDAREMVSWALATLGLPINDISPENLEKAKPVLSEWLPQVKVYDSDSPKTALLNGDVDLGVVWSGEAAILWKKNKKFVYVLPEEGAHQFIDSLAVPKGAPNKENAEKFINYILKPEVSVLISEAFPYTNPNTEAVKLLKPEQRANPASYPPGNPKLETFKDIGKAAKDIDKLVTDLKSKRSK
ncbi:MAG: spermidine/putrescine transport system substrate-binding protein potC [Chthoniobacter sp.]|jgi:spermidine/putrescine transport system substrate-binding protein|nr:spermidine/putrescine transport system substrate-binding protein potC [Chthoniobacter sp.]